MIALLFTAWLPLLLILSAPIIHLVLSIRKVKNKIHTPLWKITAILFFIGLAAPLAATVLSMYCASAFYGIRCLTGYVGIAPLGWLLTIIFIPITYISCLMLEANQKDTNSQDDRIDIYNTGLYRKQKPGS